MSSSGDRFDVCSSWHALDGSEKRVSAGEDLEPSIMVQSFLSTDWSWRDVAGVEGGDCGLDEFVRESCCLISRSTHVRYDS